MQSLKDFVKRRLSIAVFILGVLAGIIQLFSLAFPDLPEIIQFIARSFLYFVIFYVIAGFVLLILSKAKHRLIKSLANQISNGVADKLIEQSRASEIGTAQPLAELSFDFSAKRYGIGYDVQSVDCIINHDGSAIVQRSITVLAYSEIDSIDTYLLVPEAARTGEERGVDYVNVESLSGERGVLITDRKKEGRALSVELTFSRPLVSGNETRFQLTEKLPPGLFAINLNTEQISQRETPYDYFAWNINRPTRRLNMEIFLPEASTPDIYRAEVRYASASGLPNRHIQREEQIRVQELTQVIREGRCVLTLEVEYPMIGLIYMIKWDPKPVNG